MEKLQAILDAIDDVAWGPITLGALSRHGNFPYDKIKIHSLDKAS